MESQVLLFIELTAGCSAEGGTEKNFCLFIEKTACCNVLVGWKAGFFK